MGVHKKTNTELSKLLDRFGWTDDAVARLMNKNRKTILNWRKRPDSMTLRNIQDLGNAIGIDSSYLSDICSGKASLDDEYND